MQSLTVGYQSDEVLVVVFQQFLAHLIIVLPMCGMFDSGSDYFVVDKIRYIFSPGVIVGDIKVLTFINTVNCW